FLGDYIYEEPNTGRGPRLHPAEEPVDLATYRHRYAWYKTDPNLQAAHAAAPWMVIWDDHEVANDYGDDQDRTNPDPKVFLHRRAAVCWRPGATTRCRIRLHSAETCTASSPASSASRRAAP